VYVQTQAFKFSQGLRLSLYVERWSGTRACVWVHCLVHPACQRANVEEELRGSRRRVEVDRVMRVKVKDGRTTYHVLDRRSGGDTFRHVASIFHDRTPSAQRPQVLAHPSCGNLRTIAVDHLGLAAFGIFIGSFLLIACASCQCVTATLPTGTAQPTPLIHRL